MKKGNVANLREAAVVVGELGVKGAGVGEQPAKESSR